MPELDIAEFLKGDDIKGDTNIRIADKGEKGTLKEGEGKEPKPIFSIGVILPSGEKKTWTMNKTSQRTLAAKWTKHTETWVNKVATLYTDDVNVRGTMRKVIYARTPE